jgi:predicted Zn-dependent protease with MMP-like domain
MVARMEDMLQVSDEEFKNIVAEAIDGVPPRYQKRLENVAFIVEDQPTEEQRQRLSLRPGDSLFGLYEGVPLPQRFGTTKLLPDKITLFKLPLLRYSRDVEELRDRVAKTVWHEVAHYFGLDHRRIHELE